MYYPNVLHHVTPQANISETVHAVTNIGMKHIYKVIYDISVYLVSFDLGLPLKVKSRSQTFKRLCLINGTFIWSKFVTSHIWPFSLPYNIWHSGHSLLVTYLGSNLSSRHLTLDNFSSSNQCYMTFKRMYLLNMLNGDIWPWVALKGKIKVIGYWCIS